MKKLNLFSRMCSPRVGSRKDEGRTRYLILGRLSLTDCLPFSKPKVNWLLHIFDSFTCRLRVCPLKLVAVLAILLTLGVGNVLGANETATLSFSAKCNGSGTDNKSHSWEIESDAVESSYDANHGIHYGTNSATVSYVDISTSAITGTVSEIVVHASRGSNTASISVSVGGTAYKIKNTNNTSAALTTTDAAYTFTGSSSGKVLVHLYKASATKKAIYCMSVAVTYSTGSTKTLTYNANGATGGTVPTDATAYNVNDAATVKLNSGGLWKVGHSFDGWNLAANGSGKTYVNPDTFKIRDSGNTLYAKWGNTYAGSEFTLVESLSELSAGSKIILVGTNAAGNSFFAMDTTQTGNAYRGQVASGAANSFSLSNSNKTITLGASTKVQVIELKDLATPATNTYQFYVETGYLYASSSSANELRTQSTNDANGHWLIELSEGAFTITAQGSNTRKILSYNNSATRFAAYTAIQQPTYIYVMEEGTKYTITWANGGHGTAPTSPTSASKVTLPELTYDGWQHTGWKANQAVTDVSTSSSISSGTLIANGKRVQLGANTTFTAQWKQILAAPTFSPEANTFNTTQSVELSCATVSGCSFRYTTDGSTPTSSSGTVYSGAISVTQTTTIKAIAYKDGCVDSEVATGVFTLKCVAPSFDVTAGTYTGAQTVAISSSTAGATIHYTTDGSTPTGESTTYSTPLTVDCSKTIKAIAVKTGWSNSNQGSATYHIKYNVTWKVDNAVYTPGSGGGGGTNGTASVECGNQVTQLPTPPDPAYNCGDKFMGWTTDEDYSDDSAPDDLFTTAGDSPEISDHTTFYAVFADYTTD